MVVVVDLDDLEDNQDPSRSPDHCRLNLVRSQIVKASPPDIDEDEPDERPNPNVNSFSAALSCYPVVLEIARHLDLNSLHDLSSTCRQFRANLLPFRSQLVRHTLHCSNETQELGSKLGDRLREAHHGWTGVGANGRTYQGRITSGKVSRCARDMVGECRRCGTVVCRNCTAKTPPSQALIGRHRRLCKVCMKASLHKHTLQPPNEPHPEQHSGIHLAARSLESLHPETSFTSPAFARDACTCESMVFLCFSCGNAIRSSDTTYMRGWTWRTRYSTYLGGLGTGIGEGNEGVECGRGGDCLAAKEVEKEIDCDAEELAGMRREIEKVEREGRDWGGSSYMMQEMEGIGGVVKKKVKKRVKVGSVVKEYEDERESTAVLYLSREQEGTNRSWCAWCCRVIPGIKDLEDGSQAGSSASSTKS